MLPYWRHFEGMATLTIKNLPDEIYIELTQIAKKNRRSINSEAIVSVERGLDRHQRTGRLEVLDRIRRRREELASLGVWVTEDTVAESRKELVRRTERLMQELESGTDKKKRPGTKP